MGTQETARTRETVKESLSLQIAWAGEDNEWSDLDVEVDVLDYGAAASRDMPAEGPTCRITRVVETLCDEADCALESEWPIATLPKGLVALVEDLVAQSAVRPSYEDEVAMADYAWHRDADHWVF
jgi:hypothetical protein